MSKKRGWLGLIKRLLFPESHQQQKIKRRRWLFGRLKRTKTLPSLSSPPTQSNSTQISEHVEEEKQSKFEDDFTKDVFKCEQDLLKCSEIIANDANITPLYSQHESHLQTIAAIKIQTVYRGYLARKALRALKGFVRLQAIIRGRAVRRQAMTTLKCLQSIAKIQSEVCARRCQLIRVKDGDLQLQDLSHENPKVLPCTTVAVGKVLHLTVQLCRLRRLDDELLTKEEEIDIILRKKEAILRSKRVKAYSFNHRHSADAVLDCNTQGRLRYWLEQYVGDEVEKKEGKLGGKQHKLRNVDDLNNLDITSLPRKSFHKHKKQNSYGEDILHPISPINLPTYMAATESAKARTRSTSSPRLRPLHFEAYSDSDSPYKNKLFSPMSSINSEATSSGFSKVSNKCSFSSPHQKSPSFKGISGPFRSNKNLK